MKKSNKNNDTSLQSLIDGGLSYNEAVAVIHILTQKNKSSHGGYRPDLHITIQNQQGGEK